VSLQERLRTLNVSLPLAPERAARLLVRVLGGPGSGNFGHQGGAGGKGNPGGSTSSSRSAAEQALVARAGTTSNVDATGFVLRDGTRVPHGSYHHKIAAGGQDKLNELLREGVIRYVPEGIHVERVPTENQARLVIDDWSEKTSRGGRGVYYVDVGDGDTLLASKVFDLSFERSVTADDLRGFVKNTLAARALGGPGSGHHGHAGRPGQQGGSSSRGDKTGASLADQLIEGREILSRAISRPQGTSVSTDEERRQDDLAAAQTNPLAHPPFVLGQDNAISGELSRYVAAYGQEFTGRGEVANHEMGRMKECYRNASLLVMSRPDLTYAEGFATSAKTGDLAFMHAWAVDAEGKVYDATWRDGTSYFGVKYQRAPYLKQLYKAKFYGVLGGKFESAQKAIQTGGAGLRDEGLKALGGPGPGFFGHTGRPGQIGGSSKAATDLGTGPMPVFDEDDEHSPEWRVLLSHDAFLDRLEEGADDDENYREMNDAVDKYVHEPDVINRALRDNPDLMDEDEHDEEDDEEDQPRRVQSLGKTARLIEDVMADAPKIRQPITVYRGLRGATVEQFTQSESVLLNGFQSTSFDPRVAASFMGEKSGGLTTGRNLNGVLLRIRAKYGLALGHAHSVDGEMEFLMPHQGTYDVRGVSRVVDGARTFSMIDLVQR
jgi:hypothetical protein